MSESCGGSNMANIFFSNIVCSAIKGILKFLLCAEHNQVVLALIKFYFTIL